MRQVHESELLDELSFAKLAAAEFAADSSMSSFSDGEIERGCLLALRWGLGDDCVLVMKLDEIHTPTIYVQQVRLADAATKDVA
jgi:hypothetical protein